MLLPVMDCFSNWHRRADFLWIFSKSPDGALHWDCCWSGGALFHLGYKHTHTHRGRIINNATATVMNQDRWWQKLGDEYIQISVPGRYMKYYCVREKTFSTIMPIPQARDPALKLWVKFDFSWVPLTHHCGVGAPFIKQYQWCLSLVLSSFVPFWLQEKESKIKTGK